MELNVPRYPLALVLVITLLGATTIRPAQPSAEIVIRNGVMWEIAEWPRMTIRRGEVVYENGRVTGEAGSGQLVYRERMRAPML